MIYDHIRNISLYKGISPALDTALEFLVSVNNEKSNGVETLTNGVKAIISEYATKMVNENGYEAHKQFIDIQYPLNGLEKVGYCPIEYLKATTEYNQEKDYMLFEAKDGLSFTIGNGYFLILFPEDGHMPQLCDRKPSTIKKLTLKVPV